MPAHVFNFSDYTTKPGEFSLLMTDLPGRGVNTLGVLLLDPARDVLYVRLRRDLHMVASEEDAEVVAELRQHLEAEAQRRAGAAVLEHLEQDASLSIRVSDREAVTVRGFDRTLGELYWEHVPSEVLEFRTHLPRYSLAVAAGPFLTNPEDVTAEEWIEVPEDLKLDPNMFVARIQGTPWNLAYSMAACVSSDGALSARAITAWCLCAILNWQTITSTQSSATGVKSGIPKRASNRRAFDSKA